MSRHDQGDGMLMSCYYSQVQGLSVTVASGRLSGESQMLLPYSDEREAMYVSHGGSECLLPNLRQNETNTPSTETERDSDNHRTLIDLLSDTTPARNSTALCPRPTCHGKTDPRFLVMQHAHNQRLVVQGPAVLSSQPSSRRFLPNLQEISFSPCGRRLLPGPKLLLRIKLPGQRPSLVGTAGAASNDGREVAVHVRIVLPLGRLLQPPGVGVLLIVVVRDEARRA